MNRSSLLYKYACPQEGGAHCIHERFCRESWADKVLFQKPYFDGLRFWVLGKNNSYLNLDARCLSASSFWDSPPGFLARTNILRRSCKQFDYELGSSKFWSVLYCVPFVPCYPEYKSQNFHNRKKFDKNSLQWLMVEWGIVLQILLLCHAQADEREQKFPTDRCYPWIYNRAYIWSKCSLFILGSINSSHENIAFLSNTPLVTGTSQSTRDELKVLHPTMLNETGFNVNFQYFVKGRWPIVTVT